MTYKQQAEELNAEIKTLKEKKVFCKPHAELIQLSINKKLVFAEALKAKIESEQIKFHNSKCVCVSSLKDKLYYRCNTCNHSKDCHEALEVLK